MVRSASGWVQGGDEGDEIRIQKSVSHRIAYLHGRDIIAI
jgi:hypothetical protein